MTIEDRMTNAILEVVAGDRNWRDLEEFGLSVRLSADKVAVLGQPKNPVKVDMVQVARGWLHHSADERALREWARLIHGGVSLLDLDFGNSAEADALRDVLWRAAFGETITSKMHSDVRRCLVNARPV